MWHSLGCSQRDQGTPGMISSPHVQGQPLHTQLCWIIICLGLSAPRRKLPAPEGAGFQLLSLSSTGFNPEVLLFSRWDQGKPGVWH